jgi:uncharacterized protein YjiS (DUF1127 family)
LRNTSRFLISAVKSIHFTNAIQSGRTINRFDARHESHHNPKTEPSAKTEPLEGKTMFASLHTAQLTYRQVQKGGTFDRLAREISLALTALRQRQHLSRLDDAALADIGLTRSDALSEAARPLWDVPSAWRR